VAETQAISEMAEILSDSLFPVFKWARTGPVNQNWACVLGEKHFNKKTHPSDVVFYYDDPYSKARVYINVDLKSYAKGSIDTRAVQGAIRSLHVATECANSSAEWQDMYLHSGFHTRVHSMLFIYNHDDEYDADFDLIHRKCVVEIDALPEKSKVCVFGPRQVSELATIANDLELFISRKGTHKYEFFYPELSSKANLTQEWKAAATIELLTSNVFVVRYEQSDSNHGAVIYYRSKGETREEFMYLIDYLFHYQVVRNSLSIDIRLVAPAINAVSNFDKAKEQFILACEDDDAEGLSSILDKMKARGVTSIVKQYSESEIGMRNVS